MYAYIYIYARIGIWKKSTNIHESSANLVAPWEPIKNTRISVETGHRIPSGWLRQKVGMKFFGMKNDIIVVFPI